MARSRSGTLGAATTPRQERAPSAVRMTAGEEARRSAPPTTRRAAPRVERPTVAGVGTVRAASRRAWCRGRARRSSTALSAGAMPKTACALRLSRASRHTA
ncbi:hypothetical protein [Streptomyces cavourensis]|uniref:hypothetical protein n=1 Tax=Streptomyces cavourensis TaxID=67258 RepID=UPI0020C9B888|nr:hypothetical protein [Streptomyces cavourensis]